MWLLLLTRYRKYEVCFVSVPPMGYLLNLVLPNRFSMVIWDVYPETLRITGMKETHPVYRLWAALNRRSFRKAWRIFTNSEAMAENLSQYVDRRRLLVQPIWSIFQENSWIRPIRPRARGCASTLSNGIRGPVLGQHRCDAHRPVPFRPPARKLYPDFDPFVEACGVSATDKLRHRVERLDRNNTVREFDGLGRRRGEAHISQARNGVFEPSDDPSFDSVGHALNRAAAAFRWREPAIISPTV